MAYKKALTDAEVSKENFKSFKKWASANAKKIVAQPNKTIVYAGGRYDVKIRYDDKSDKAIVTNTKMWQAIQAINDRRKKSELPAEFETLEDVLKRIKHHPTLIDRDRLEIRGSHMYEYMRTIQATPKHFPKSEIAKCWSILSEHYAANAEGHVGIADGVTEDYALIGKEKILIANELEKLLKNDKLSDHSKRQVEEVVGKYLKEMDGETRKELKAILKERDSLRKKIANARATKKA